MSQLGCSRWPRKVRYRTEARAVRALVALTQAGMGQKRIYRCEHCRGWHSTTQEVRRRTGDPTPLPAGFVALVTWPGHEPGARIVNYYFPWRH